MIHTDVIETFEHAGCKVNILYDNYPISPRECGHLGIMVCSHSDYDIGDRKPTSTELEAFRRGGFPLLSRYLRMTEHAVCVLPLGLIDHSGISMYIGEGPHCSDSAGWDSGTVGFIYASKADIETYGTPAEYVRDSLVSEVEEYDKYIRGDCYGYVIEHISALTGDVEEEESCWGFFGIDNVIETAKEVAESLGKLTLGKV